MKLVKIDNSGLGLLVELPAGPHVVDLANSLGVFAAHDPLSAGLINGTLNEKCVWGALVTNWRYLRKPLELLARTALADPDDTRLVLHPFAYAQQRASDGIFALDIADAADLEMHDPTGRCVMARQFGEAVVEQVEQNMPSLGESSEVIDFLRYAGSKTPHS